MSDNIFFHPDVLRVIRAILVSKGIREPETLKDAIGAVVLACIEHAHEVGRWPETVKEAIAFVRVVTNRKAINEMLKWARRSKTDAGPTNTADEHAALQLPSMEPGDLAKIVEAMKEVLTDEQIKTLIDVGSGVPHAELAAESGVSEATHRKRVQTWRERAKAVLLSKGFKVTAGMAALLAGMVAIYIGPWRDGDVAATRPDSGRPLTRAIQMAWDQRNLAAQTCEEKKWDECEKALDEGAKLDPEGDKEDDNVAALRKAIATARAEAGAGDGGRGVRD